MRLASSARSTTKVQLGIPQTASTSVFYATLSLSIFLSRLTAASKAAVDPFLTLPVGPGRFSRYFRIDPSNQFAGKNVPFRLFLIHISNYFYVTF